MGKRLTELEILDKIDELTKENEELLRQIEDNIAESDDEIDDLMMEKEDRQDDIEQEYEEKACEIEEEYEEMTRPLEKEYDAREAQIKRYKTLLQKRTTKGRKKTVKK